MKKVSLNQWFFENLYLPILLLVTSTLILSLAIFIYSGINSINTNRIFINQVKENISLAISQKNRPQIENIISSLQKTGQVRSAVICQGEKRLIGKSADENICNKNGYFVSIYNLQGIDNFKLVIQFINPASTFTFKFFVLLILILSLLTFFSLKKFKHKYDRDLINVVLNLDSDDTSTLIFELNDLRNQLALKRDLELKLEKEKLQNLISLQVYHDIRSPLAVLKYASLQNFKLNNLDIAQSAIDRISRITDDLLKRAKRDNLENPTLIFDKVKITNLLETVVKEKELEFIKFKNLKISLNISSNAKNIDVVIDKLNLERVLSNLLNNSAEAMKYIGVIELGAFSESDEFIIKIKDHGGGIPGHVLENIGKPNCTTKENGNGLGVFHAKQSIEKQNGKIQFENIDRGLEVKIIFKICEKESKEIVLLDDDELIRILWSTAALNKKIPFRTCKNYQELCDLKSSLDGNTIFYIDSELNDSKKGEDIARELFEEGFLNLNLCTGHSSERFRELSFLKGVISKVPPF